MFCAVTLSCFMCKEVTVVLSYRQMNELRQMVKSV